MCNRNFESVKTAIKNEKFNGAFIYKNINKNKPGH